ncbi:MAG: hypothetical protein MI974_15175 [Chitinophagales bacterium]|nr:hypothetical protein [Chitinophagales bacterium]
MYRIKFLKKLEQYLSQTSLVLLKYKGGSLSELPLYSDIDLWAKEKDAAKAFISWCYRQSGIEIINTYSRNDVLHCYIFFKDQGFLQLDILWELSRKGLVYISQNTINKHTIQHAGIHQTDDYLLFTHVVLFNFLNGSAVPQHYIKYWQEMPIEEQQSLLYTFNNEYGTAFDQIGALKNYDEEACRKIKGVIRKLKENTFPKLLRNRTKYLWSKIREFAGTHKGIVITFSGVDGAGKSTVLSKVSSVLSFKYRRRVVCLRHRPAVFPILSSFTMGKEQAEIQATSALPRTGSNKNLLSSIFRFMYYYLDYLIGQVYIYWRYIAQGYVVLYDRYYFDFIVDGLRTNIRISPGFVKMLYSLVYKPALNVFLYADAETILARKQELSTTDIKQLTSAYLKLFNDLQLNGSQKYLAIENMHLPATLNEIEREYIQIQST